MRFKINYRFYDVFLKKINFGIVKKIFFLTSISYFCFYFFNNFGQVSFGLDFKKDANNIFFSFLFCILSIFLNALAWKNIVIWFGKNNIKNNLISFYILTNILKYVPGGIWHFVERFNFIKDISTFELAFYSTLIEPYFMLCASFFLASIGIVFSPFYFLLLIPLIFLNRNLIYFILRSLESLKGQTIKALIRTNSKNKIEERLIINSFFPSKSFLIEIGFVLTKFIGFIICFNIFNLDNEPKFFYLFVIFCLSWSIGLIVPTAPGGVGVFEASFLFLIGKSIPQNVIFVSLIYFRLISTSADLLLSLPFLLRKLLKRI